MRNKTCGHGDCFELAQPGSPYCDPHRRAHQARASSAERGYGGPHQRERKRRLAVKHLLTCPYCGTSCALIPDPGLHLPHTDDRSGYLPGLSCAPCNTSAAGKASHRRTA